MPTGQDIPIMTREFQADKVNVSIRLIEIFDWIGAAFAG
jgi:hypothetical protein